MEPALPYLARGEAQQFETHVEESVLGQAEYSIQRACLSEDARLFEECTGTQSDDRSCRRRLEDARARCDARADADTRESTRDAAEIDSADRPEAENSERVRDTSRDVSRDTARDTALVILLVMTRHRESVMTAM